MKNKSSSLFFLLILAVLNCCNGRTGVQGKENMLNKFDAKNKTIEGSLSEKNNLKKAADDQNITDKYWKLVELMGKKLSVNVNNAREAHFILQTDNSSVAGNGGCNTFNGTYELTKENRVRFSKIVSTRMACPDMEIESEFFKVFDSADNYSLKGDTLYLNKAGLPPLAKFVTGYLK